MSQDKVKLNEILVIFIPLAAVLLVNHYFAFFEYFGSYDPHELVVKLNGIVQKHILIIRAAYIALIIAASVLNSKRTKKKTENFSYLIIALILVLIFFNGYTTSNHYNLYFYPGVILLVSFFTYKACSFFTLNEPTEEEEKPKLFSETKKETDFSFKLPTEYGPLHLNKTNYGVGIEGGAGSGKTVLMQSILDQACQNGFAGVLYDYEGDCREPDGAALTRTVMSGLHRYNSGDMPFGRVGFAYLNFADPSRTVRVNPLSTQYIENHLDLAEFAKTLMTNLEPEWLKKTDFWAGNAINYAEGILIRLFNDPKLHKYLTIPHLAMICTHNYETVFKWILQDKTLERKMMPLYVAAKKNATNQIVGAVSSTALPITKLLQPEIFYPLSPETPDETFDLDITNEQHPVFLSVGSIPKIKHVLGPVCSLVLLICMNNMNRFGKRRSIFGVDELPTLFIPNLDNLPATARKKGVTTMLAWQDFEQLIDEYGERKAKITRGNLSNQFIGKTRNSETAKRIVEYFGKEVKHYASITTSDSGESVSYQRVKEDRLEMDKVLNQPIGHFTGVLPEGTPPYFHAQFDNFEPKLESIPAFSKKWFTDEEHLDQQLMKNDVQENYNRIEREVNQLMAPYEEKVSA